MSISRTTEYLDAAIHLPAGGKLTLYDVSWDEYEELLEEIGDRPRLRVSYKSGRVEIMSPSGKHEKLKNLINSLINLCCLDLEMEWVSLGSVTLKTATVGGVEADDCFYFGAAKSIIRKDRLDLAHDPPPDLVVEIDLSSDSYEKLSIYASLGVREVWRYAKDKLQILELRDGQYHSISASVFLPMPTPERIMQYIADCESNGQLAAQRSLRAWLQAVQKSKAGK